ncbi:UbiA family prenyltransferase [Oceaniglobus roseus]|uniref:UbiA family prenyltransferase n=1 Tax=Oceaniglobus roseus TaxID=1737570 RepID=UPI001FE72006|nr:UbiA family prenyltransferase [Kandeliimicrobium roseum]
MTRNGTGQVLAVDLDGTLLRTDMLAESFWAATAADSRTPLRALAALRRGRAALKRMLAERVVVDPAVLPYDADVVAFVRDWRARGGRTVLVTASDTAIARSIAAHLELFDEVHGSDGAENLKGARKAAFLVARFGTGGFVYAGDSRADLPVWQAAAAAVTVNASPRLRHAVDALGLPVEHLRTLPPSAAPWIRAMRPHQWLKNLLVFLPMLAAHRFDGATGLASLLAFAAFSVIASGVYLLNDLLDLAADRAHPRKRFRPLAAGALPIFRGSGLMAGLMALGAVLSLLAGPPFAAVMLAYLLLTTAYSLVLKRRRVIDIAVLAGLYTLRIVAGGAATGIPLSMWLLAFSIFFFFSLAAVKRQAELVDSAARGRLGAGGRGYVVEDLPVISMMAVASGYVSVLVMALYVTSPAVLELYARPAALGGICCVLLYWISRIVLLTHRGEMLDDPVVFALRDPVSRACLGLILLFALAGTLP